MPKQKSYLSDPDIKSSLHLSTADDVARSRTSSKTPRYLTGLITAVALIVIVVLVAHNKSSTPPLTKSSNPPAYVSITSSGYLPATISIKKGQAVVWTNTTNATHDVDSDPYPSDNALAGFKSPSVLNDNQTYSFVFNETGTFSYHDDLNPGNYKGDVVVK